VALKVLTLSRGLDSGPWPARAKRKVVRLPGFDQREELLRSEARPE